MKFPQFLAFWNRLNPGKLATTPNPQSSGFQMVAAPSLSYTGSYTTVGKPEPITLAPSTGVTNSELALANAKRQLTTNAWSDLSNQYQLKTAEAQAYNSAYSYTLAALNTNKTYLNAERAWHELGGAKHQAAIAAINERNLSSDYQTAALLEPIHIASNQAEYNLQALALDQKQLQLLEAYSNNDIQRQIAELQKISIATSLPDDVRHKIPIFIPDSSNSLAGERTQSDRQPA